MLWTREQIKTRAKAVLKQSYWKAFLVSIVLLIAEFSGGNSGSRSSSNVEHRYNFGPSNDYMKESIINNSDKILSYVIPIAMVATVVGILILAFRIFVGYGLEVGGRRYFIRSAEGNFDLNDLGYSFKDGRYINIIKAMLYKSVLVFLWTLLLIIPGIVKGYAYRMVPNILANNPNIGYKRAIEISNRMTNGEKFNIFVLDLSFLGWYLIGALALGIGVLFVHPYVNATEAELYLVLRQKAINNGICSPEELMIDEFIK